MSVEKIGQKITDPYYLNAPFTLSGGVDRYDYPINSITLSLLTLTNVEGRLNHLLATKGYSLFETLALVGGDQIMGFGFYQLPNRQYHNFYAFTQTSVYKFNFSTGQFDTVPIFSGFPNTSDPYVILPWFGALYVTKLGAPYVKLTGKIATIVPDDQTGGVIPWARYGIIAQNHVYLGGFFDGYQNQLGGIRWGDLDDPESFAFNSLASEADFFLLDPDAGEITGVSYQRGQPIVYSRNNIEIGNYIGFPGGFQHQPLFPGLGNIFHNAVVRLKEIDYFIGADNFYILNGLQTTAIGDNIFEFFINDVVNTIGTSVRGFSDTKKYQVFWVYNSISHGGLWSVVYNYKEQVWCDRDPQGLTGWLDTPRPALQGFSVINDATQVINTDATIINNDGVFPVTLAQFIGAGVKIAIPSTNANKLDGTSFACIVETFDFYFGNFNLVKEITKAVLEYTSVGNPNLTVSIASRHNQSETLVYGTPVPVTNIDGSNSFFIRTPGVGKYLRFKFTWNNTATDYITGLTLLSFVKIDTTPEENPEK